MSGHDAQSNHHVSPVRAAVSRIRLSRQTDRPPPPRPLDPAYYDAFDIDDGNTPIPYADFDDEDVDPSINVFHKDEDSQSAQFPPYTKSSESVDTKPEYLSPVRKAIDSPEIDVSENESDRDNTIRGVGGNARRLTQDYGYMYVCDICARFYSHSKSLLQHKQAMHGKKYYLCDVNGCNFSTLQKKNLRRHEASRHHSDGSRGGNLEQNPLLVQSPLSDASDSEEIHPPLMRNHDGSLQQHKGVDRLAVPVYETYPRRERTVTPHTFEDVIEVARPNLQVTDAVGKLQMVDGAARKMVTQPSPIDDSNLDSASYEAPSSAFREVLRSPRTSYRVLERQFDDPRLERLDETGQVPALAHARWPRSPRLRIPTPRAQSENPQPIDTTRVIRETRRESIFGQQAMVSASDRVDKELREARSLLERLSRREDVSDDFWDSVGLTRPSTDCLSKEPAEATFSSGLVEQGGPKKNEEAKKVKDVSSSNSEVVSTPSETSEHSSDGSQRGDDNVQDHMVSGPFQDLDHVPLEATTMENSHQQRVTERLRLRTTNSAKSTSKIPRPTPNFKFKSKPSKLAKHFEQLSHEFQKQRMRERMAEEIQDQETQPVAKEILRKPTEIIPEEHEPVREGLSTGKYIRERQEDEYDHRKQEEPAEEEGEVEQETESTHKEAQEWSYDRGTLPPGWFQADTEDGSTYYYNSTGVTQWQRPNHLDIMERSRESPVQVPQTEEISWDHVASERFGHPSFDGSSSSSSYARSVFSTASLASSATDLSRDSGGYSAVQIARATKELIRILQDDEGLVPLYKRAIRDPMIGPSRLERNLRRFFKNYAEQLGELAGDRLEYLASRLVRLKAKFVAQSIMEKYDIKRSKHRKGTTSTQEQEQSSDEEAETEAVDETEFDDLVSFCDFLVGSEAFEMLHTQMRSFVLPKMDQAGEVKGVTRNVESNPDGVEVIREEDTLTAEDPGKTTKEAKIVQKYVETITEDLDTATNDDKTIHAQNLGSQFDLANSITHVKARTQVPGRSWSIIARVGHAGSQPKVAEDMKKNVENTTDIKTTTSNVWMAQSVSELNKAFVVQGGDYVDCFRSIAKATRLVKDFAGAALIASKCLEPALRPGHTRLRWQCGCGDTFYEDIRELREGGVVRLTERMQSSMGIKAIATSYNHSASNQKYTFAASSWVRGIGRKVSGVFSQSNNTAQGLPQHTSQTTTSTCAPTGSVPVQRSLHLIACMRHDRYRRILYQDPIDKISTDKELFSLMRAQLAQRRGAVRNIFSCTRIQGLRLIKFNLWPNGHPDFREGDSSCLSPAAQKCDCIPPKDRVVPSVGAEYQCTPAGPGDTCPPIPLNILMHSLMEPDHIPTTQTLVFDQLPKLVCGELKARVNQTTEGWGIHFQEGWDSSKLSSMILGIFLLASLLFAVLWSHFKLDVQGAFGVSAYMVTAAGIFVAWVANRPGNMVRVH